MPAICGLYNDSTRKYITSLSVLRSPIVRNIQEENKGYIVSLPGNVKQDKISKTFLNKTFSTLEIKQ